MCSQKIRQVKICLNREKDSGCKREAIRTRGESVKLLNWKQSALSSLEYNTTQGKKEMEINFDVIYKA